MALFLILLKTNYIRLYVCLWFCSHECEQEYKLDPRCHHYWLFFASVGRIDKSVTILRVGCSQMSQSVILCAGAQAGYTQLFIQPTSSSSLGEQLEIVKA